MDAMQAHHLVSPVRKHDLPIPRGPLVHRLGMPSTPIPSTDRSRDAPFTAHDPTRPNPMRRHMPAGLPHRPWLIERVDREHGRSASRRTLPRMTEGLAGVLGELLHVVDEPTHIPLEYVEQQPRRGEPQLQLLRMRPCVEVPLEPRHDERLVRQPQLPIEYEARHLFRPIHQARRHVLHLLIHQLRHLRLGVQEPHGVRLPPVPDLPGRVHAARKQQLVERAARLVMRRVHELRQVRLSRRRHRVLVVDDQRRVVHVDIIVLRRLGQAVEPDRRDTRVPRREHGLPVVGATRDRDRRPLHRRSRMRHDRRGSYFCSGRRDPEVSRSYPRATGGSAAD